MGAGASTDKPTEHPDAVAALARIDALEKQMAALTTALEATGASGAGAGAAGTPTAGTASVKETVNMPLAEAWAILRDFTATEPWNKGGFGMRDATGGEVGATRMVDVTVPLPDGTTTVVPVKHLLTGLDDAAMNTTFNIVSHPMLESKMGLTRTPETRVPEGDTTTFNMTWYVKAAEPADDGKCVMGVDAKFACDTPENTAKLTGAVSGMFPMLINKSFNE